MTAKAEAEASDVESCAFELATTTNKIKTK